MSVSDAGFPWVLFTLAGEYFALSSVYVQSMIELPNITLAPGLPRYVRGFMNYNNEVIRLVDMRERMGFKSLCAEVGEFLDMMDAREQDHRKWLCTLKECVQEKKPFTLALDPTKCKFGQWYYDYLPKVTSNALEFLLKKFEVPHTKLHGVATQVFHLVDENKMDEATQLVDRTKHHELKKMIELFSELKEAYQKNHREIAIVLNTDATDYPTALLVDEIIAVEHLPEHHWSRINDALAGDSSGTATGIGHFPDLNVSAVTLDILRCMDFGLKQSA